MRRRLQKRLYANVREAIAALGYNEVEYDWSDIEESVGIDDCTSDFSWASVIYVLR